MAELVVPNGVRVVLHWTLSGQEYALNVFHMAVQGSVDVNAAYAAVYATHAKAAFIAGAVGTSYQPHCATTVALAKVSIRDLRIANQLPVEAPVAAAVGSQGNPLPLGVAMCITLRTGLAGRSFRGRMYLPGWTELDNDANGSITTAGMFTGEQFVRELRTRLAGDPVVAGEMAILSRWNAKGLRVPPVLTPVISQQARDNRWDYQRRRAVPGT